MTVTVYFFQSEIGTVQVYPTLDPVAARQHALLYRLRCIAHDCDLADGNVAWDFTQNRPESGVEP